MPIGAHLASLALPSATVCPPACKHFLLGVDLTMCGCLLPTFCWAGTPLRGLIQDHVVAAVHMTKRDTFLTRETFQQLIWTACQGEVRCQQNRTALYVEPWEECVLQVMTNVNGLSDPCKWKLVIPQRVQRTLI